MQRLGGGGYTRKRKQRGAGNNPSCGCDMQAGWPKFLTENIPLPTAQSGGGCGCTGGLLPQMGGGQPAAYNSNPVPDACPFPGTGYCGFYAKGGSTIGPSHPITTDQRGGANYGEPMNLQARLRGGKRSGTRKRAQRGAGCGCMTRRGGSRVTSDHRGGSRMTKREKKGLNNALKDLQALAKWRKGQSIGFSMEASLKAKGLIPRTSKKYKGKKVVSAKYK